MRPGKVYLVGAGPGDPGLITCLGMKMIRDADVIIYDRLVSKELLDQARLDSIKVFAGKGMGESEKQDHINQLLLSYASEGKMVIRLKGGDPFVFGRGEEECIYLLQRGIQCEVVPGVTSALAVPASAGIPVTSRLASSGVTIVTAVRSNGEVLEAEYIPSKGTLVILMGVHVVDQLKRRLLEVRLPMEPVAVIEKGTLPEQRVFVDVLERLDQVVKENQVRAPAIFVVGEVVKMRDKLKFI